jgi:peptidyl-dipeptidase A
MLFGCGNAQEKELQGFITAHVRKIDPLKAHANYVFWEAETTGDEEKFDKLSRLRFEIDRIYSSGSEFAFLKRIRESGEINDPKLARQLDKLYNAYLSRQIAPEMLKQIVDLDTAITKTYNGHRGTIDGEKVTMSDIYLIMTTETDVVKREKAWLAAKQVGNVIVEDLIKLVKLRNHAARKLGFDNWHSLTLITGEQSVEEVDRILAELEELTRGPFAKLKGELDIILAKSYGISPGQLMPWHYHDPFFQRTPLVYELNLDEYYKNSDVKVLSEKYYAGVGLPVDDILARSDLYDREGKNPHAFAEDIDRHGDVRILCNLNNDERWMETVLHELGHAVYAKYHDRQLPYLLREPAHSFTTEAIAMFFGRLSRNAAWMQEMLELSDRQRSEIEEVSMKYLRFQQILFVRWEMVMYNFEKQLYADPDQDLNTLWWDLVEKYQLVKRPRSPADAGWASKLHFTVAPCYYHNYMLGELFASQLHNHIVTEILGQSCDKDVSYVNDRRVGDFLRKKVLAPAALYQWNDMIIRATGEPLTPKYFVRQFVE